MSRRGRVDRHPDLGRPARPEGDLVVADQPLGWLTGAGRQPKVDLRGLGACPAADVADTEADLHVLRPAGMGARRADRELPVPERGVGQAVAEREQRGDAGLVVALVADIDALAVDQARVADAGTR